MIKIVLGTKYMSTKYFKSKRGAMNYSGYMSTVRPRFYHRFRQRRNSDKIGVSDKIDGTWNKRKPPFFNYVCTFLCRDENAYHKFHIKITSYSHELVHI